jgi:hypothetical protein
MFNKLSQWFFGAREKRGTTFWLVVILVGLAVIWSVGAFLSGNSTNFGRLANWADFTRYQAVFLTNGQVYFGKVMDVNSQTLVLEDIYYLRSTKNLQVSEEKLGVSTEADNFSLVKLGKEIHGPEDKMSINLSQVLFVENLKYDSRVVEAIREYKSKK